MIKMNQINKMITDIFEKLNLSVNKAEKDIGIYKSSISKMVQAKELIEELKIKNKNKNNNNNSIFSSFIVFPRNISNI